ncbi:MAG TPA: sigma-70 family RNA polymerase sigma factor [Pirellulales bacterium]|nr:sigma-70 family RNA polymerase sigma factor [Pirellulales bacterium]
MHTTPVSLLVRLKQPEPEAAWQRFVELYTPLLFFWARQAGVGAPDDADLVQDVLALLVQKMPGFDYDPQQSFRGWIRTMMRNRIRDLRRRHHVPEAAVDESWLAELPAPKDDAWEEEHRQLLVSRAAEMMQASFHETTWRACWESTVNERPAAEVARMLGISENAVYIAKGRVLRRLRRELEGLL